MPMFHLPRAGAFRHADFRRYWIARLAAGFAGQILGLSVAWQIYDVSRDPFHLGMAGLALFLPSLLLVLISGAASDRFDRATVMMACILGESLCALVLLVLTRWGRADLGTIYCVLVVLGTLRAFLGPAQQSLMPDVVPRDEIPSAIAWSASTWQIATVVGPVVGGLLHDVSPEAAYITAFALLSLAAAKASGVSKHRPTVDGRPGVGTVAAGFRYIWTEKIVLGALSLDLFAMLLGGATALLPVFARDVLDVGPWGLGLLRAAPAAGSILVAALLLRRPVKDHAGPIMFASVAMVGVSIVVFGASREVWLSALALGVMGGFDMVSVYVRETLIQLWTPDAMRGRVNAVNMMILGASNELGAFRSSLSAWALGAVPAVVIGGAATVAVSALWWYLFPQLRQVRYLQKLP